MKGVKGIVKFILMMAITAFFIMSIGMLGRFSGGKKAIVHVGEGYEFQEKGDTLLIIKKANDDE